MRKDVASGQDIAKFTNSKGLFEYLQLLMPFDKIGDGDKLAIVPFMIEGNGDMKAGPQLPVGGGTVPINRPESVSSTPGMDPF